MDYLPLEVRRFDGVEIDDPQRADSRINAGDPSPPAPIASTRLLFSRRWPSIPTSGTSRWRL